MSHDASSPATTAIDEDRDQHVALAGDDLLEPSIGAAHARLARLPIDVAIELRERREQAIAQVALGQLVRRLVLAGVIQLEHAVGDDLDAALNFLGAVRERGLVGRSSDRQRCCQYLMTSPVARNSSFACGSSPLR